MNRLCIDLCSGLGGFSQAFVDAGWDVVRVDIERKFRPTIQADVKNLPLRDNIQPEVMLMSPPCERFSLAPRVWPKKGIGKALEVVGACLEAVCYLNPRNWCLENPKGRLRWLLGYTNHSPELGSYGYRTAKPTDLWGNIPFKLLDKSWTPQRNNHHIGPWKTFSDVRDPAERGKMPYGLSKSILDAITSSDEAKAK